MDAVYRPTHPGHLPSALLFHTSKSADDWRVFQKLSQSHYRTLLFQRIGIDSHRNMLVSKQGSLHESDIGEYVIWEEVRELSKEESILMAIDFYYY